MEFKNGVINYKTVFVKNCKKKLEVFQKTMLSYGLSAGYNYRIYETFDIIMYALEKLENIEDENKINNTIIYIENLFFFLDKEVQDCFFLEKKVSNF